MKKPTRIQGQVLQFVVAETDMGRAPVAKESILKRSGVSPRYVTNTVAACIDHGWLTVNQRGFAAYCITPPGRETVAPPTSEPKPHLGTCRMIGCVAGESCGVYAAPSPLARVREALETIRRGALFDNEKEAARLGLEALAELERDMAEGK